MRLVALVLLAAACSSDPTTDPLCETKVSVVDQSAWTPVPAESDPFPPPAGDADAGVGRGRCGPSDMMSEQLNLEASYTILTAMCSYATVEQPARVAIAAGEQLTMRVWYFSQTRFEKGDADVVVAFGDEPVWRRSVPLPVTIGGLLFDQFPAPASIPAGMPVRWHISNHGTNSWNILEVSVTRKVPCSEVARGEAGAKK